MSRIRLRACTLHVEVGPSGDAAIEVGYVVMNENTDMVLGHGVLKGVDDKATLSALQELLPGLDEHINRIAGLEAAGTERVL